MRRWISLILGLLLLTGCAPVSAENGGKFSTTESATVENAAAAVKTQRLTVVLNGCIAYEVDSAGGSLKTAIAAADLVVFLAGDLVPEDLAGETQAWQADLSTDDRATMDANWPGVYRCARDICDDPAAQQGLLDDAGVTTDFSAMDLTDVPAQLDEMNTALLSLQRK